MKLTWMKNIVGDAYTEEMDAAVCRAMEKDFVSRSDFNAKSQALQEKEAQCSGLNASVEAARGLQAELDRLKAQYDKDTRELQLGREVDRALMEAKARNLELARKALDLSKVTVAQDGSVSGLSQQLDALKKSDGYLFAEEPPPGGRPCAPAAPTGAAPGPTHGNSWRPCRRRKSTKTGRTLRPPLNIKARGVGFAMTKAERRFA